MPLAPPLRCKGADKIMMWLLGDWNKPKPAPHKAMRQTMSALLASIGKSASDAKPSAITPKPTPPSKPPSIRPIKRAITIETSTMQIGQAVNSKPVSTWLRLKAPSSKNGSATKASICALKAATEVPIDSANTGMRSKSSGKSGTVKRNCRRMYTTPMAMPAVSSTMAQTGKPAPSSAEVLRTPNPSTPKKMSPNIKPLSKTSIQED